MLDGRSKVVFIETFICVGVHTCARALPTRERCVAPLRGATHALIGGLGSDASRRYPIETRDEPADSCRLVIPIRHLLICGLGHSITFLLKILLAFSF